MISNMQFKKMCVLFVLLLVTMVGCYRYANVITGEMHDSSSEALQSQLAIQSQLISRISQTDNPIHGNAALIEPSDVEIQKYISIYGRPGSEQINYIISSYRNNIKYVADATRKRGIFDSIEIRQHEGDPASFPVGANDFVIFCDDNGWAIRGKDKSQKLPISFDKSVPKNYDHLVLFLDSINQQAQHLKEGKESSILNRKSSPAKVMTPPALTAAEPKPDKETSASHAKASTVKPPSRLPTHTIALTGPYFPPNGTRYSYTVKKLGKKWSENHVVLGEGVYEGRQVYQVKLEGKDGLILYDLKTGNWMRTEIEGSTVGSAQPYEDIFRYPLEVGNKHRSEFYYFDHVTTGNTRATVNVVSFKDIKVPAGTFKAYQIVAWESSAIAGASYGSTWWRKKTLWYSPDLKIVVKMVDTNHPDSHTTTTELLEYIEP